MASKKIIFYTDCYIFGGCEKPIFEIISSEDFLRTYEYLLVYRTTKEYEEGMRAEFSNIPRERIRGVAFPEIHTWHLYIEKRIGNISPANIARKCASVLFRILRPFIFIYETVVLYYLFLKERADVVHVNNGGYPGALSCRAAVLAARLSGTRHVILGVHNMVQRSRGIVDPIIDFFVRRAASRIVSVSDASGLTLSANRGFDSKRIVTIYNGVKDADISCRGAAEKNISMVARFEGRKGHLLALRALKKLIAGHPELSDAKIVFLGEGPLLSAMERIASGEGLGKNVMFLGHRRDSVAYIASSLFLISPSLEYESLPYSILESMSSGIPAIGARVGGIPEEIEDGVSGILVPPGDSDALAGAMFSLLSDERRRSAMGIEAKKRFRRFFTLDAMVNNYIALYDRTLA